MILWYCGGNDGILVAGPLSSGRMFICLIKRLAWIIAGMGEQCQKQLDSGFQ